jgi:ATP-dependent DNA helicase RecG
MTEINRIEYKAQLTKDLDLEKEVVAFLNYLEGGLVYIGIGKKRQGNYKNYFYL